jgi:hypothetical protein
MATKPRKYKLKDPEELRRLHAEVLGYLKTDREAGCGTDIEGRQFAIDALHELGKEEEEENKKEYEEEGAVLSARKGGHRYGPVGATSNCAFGCECWMGRTNSGGPRGVDPFGKCPKNPMNKG